MKFHKIPRRKFQRSSVIKKVWMIGLVVFLLTALRLNSYLFREFKYIISEQNHETSLRRPTSVAFYPQHISQDIVRGASCQAKKYIFVDDISDADILLVNRQFIEDISNLLSMKKKHKRDQVWVYYSPKPPPIHGPDQDMETISNFKTIQHIFDYTMTYRYNSSIPINTFTMSKLKETKTGQQLSFSKENISKRPRRVAWLPNRCSQSLDPFLNKLVDTLDIDIIGSCSMNYSPCRGQVLSNSSTECRNFVKSNYLFLLSVDEYFCPQYLSTDVFIVWLLDLIPIVISGYNNLTKFPEGSYIRDENYDAQYFANEIKKIQNIPTAELIEMFFTWKKDIVVQKSNPLCDLLNTIGKIFPQNKIHGDWVTEEFRCYPDWLSYGGLQNSFSNAYFIVN